MIIRVLWFKSVVNIFFVFGTAFLVIGLLLIRDLKHHYTDFYQEEKAKIIAATLILTISLYARATLDLLERTISPLKQAETESLINNTNFTPIYIFFKDMLVEVGPIWA